MPITVNEHMANARKIRDQKRELRKRYMEALEDVLNMFPEDMKPARGIAFVASACDTVNRARALRAEIGGKR